jgi:3-dehydroquinate synthase class II
MIPTENLIAAAQFTGTKIAFYVSQSQDIIGLSNALELGVDALCIKTGLSYHDPDLWKIVFKLVPNKMMPLRGIKLMINHHQLSMVTSSVRTNHNLII